MSIESHRNDGWLASRSRDSRLGKLLSRNRSRTRRPIIVGGAILLVPVSLFWFIPGFSSRVDAEKRLEKTVKLIF